MFSILYYALMLCTLYISYNNNNNDTNNGNISSKMEQCLSDVSFSYAYLRTDIYTVYYIFIQWPLDFPCHPSHLLYDHMKIFLRSHRRRSCCVHLAIVLHCWANPAFKTPDTWFWLNGRCLFTQNKYICMIIIIIASIL